MRVAEIISKDRPEPRAISSHDGGDAPFVISRAKSPKAGIIDRAEWSDGQSEKREEEQERFHE